MCLLLRIIRHGWTWGSSRHGEANATSPTRAMTHAGRSMQMSTTLFTPNILSWLPTWMTWRRTPSGKGDLLHYTIMGIVTGTFWKRLWEWQIFPPELFVVETERSRSGGELLPRGFESGKNPTDFVAWCIATVSGWRWALQKCIKRLSVDRSVLTSFL